MIGVSVDASGAMAEAVSSRISKNITLKNYIIFAVVSTTAAATAAI